MAASMWKICRRNQLLRNFTFSSLRQQYLAYSSQKSDSTVTPVRERTPLDIENLFNEKPEAETIPNFQSQISDQHGSPVIQPGPVETKSFATLLRESKFMQLGDLNRRLFSGRIFEVQGDDLYIEFGGKFHCVCSRPAFQSE